MGATSCDLEKLHKSYNNIFYNFLIGVKKNKGKAKYRVFLYRIKRCGVIDNDTTKERGCNS